MYASRTCRSLRQSSSQSARGLRSGCASSAAPFPRRSRVLDELTGRDGRARMAGCFPFLTRRTPLGGTARDVGVRVRCPPLQEILVPGEDGVDHLVKHVLGWFADEVRVRVQRLVRLMIQARPMPDELLAASARFDQ